MWIQQLNKLGLISLNKLGTLENVADLLTKHVPRAVLDKLAGMMGYTFPDEETQKFQEYTSINKNFGIRSCHQLRDYRCSTMEKTNRWRMDVHSFVDKTSHLTTAVFSRGDEMNILWQPYSHQQQSDLLSYVAVS